MSRRSCTLAILLLSWAGTSGAASPAGSTPVRLPTADEGALGGFATSSVCAPCHSNAARATAMRDERDREISPFLLWSGTQMANSFRDVVWRAVVSAEISANPAHAGEIATKCMRCHAPMAARALEPDTVVRQLGERAEASQLAIDGVSCTVCHRIAADRLGEPETFSGRFPLGKEDEIHGPHDDLFTRPMLHHSGYVPVHGTHVVRSALCGTCHTLHTDALRPDGAAAGVTFLEQAPYLEWRNSAFVDEEGANGREAASCQSCHMPTTSVDGRKVETRIARNPGGRDFPPTDPREPFGRHLFVGGNTLVPRLLAGQGQAMSPHASTEALEEVARMAEEQLERRTAWMGVSGTKVEGRRLTFDVSLENLTGHKFPTGHPARRAWLRVRVLDSRGKVLFASGEHDRQGRILDGQGRPLEVELPGGGAAPHRDTVGRATEVQIYELAMIDSQGATTHALLRGAGAAKDDRLLPRGWRSDHPDAMATRPIGVEGDASFLAGGDVVRYVVDLPRGSRPARVEATLLYQTLGARYAAELFQAGTPETRELEAMLEVAGNAPVRVAQATVLVK